MTDQSNLSRTLELIRMKGIVSKTEGDPNLTIGIIDGPVDTLHSNFSNTDFKPMDKTGRCLLQDSLACRHGTFITGMLAGHRNGETTALAPKCSFVLYPIFCESEVPGNACPEITPRELAHGLMKVIEAGANVVNLSMGLISGAIQAHPDLDDAFDYAMQKGVIVVGASGNQGRIGYLPLFDHNWVVPVAMCDQSGRPTSESNMGASIGRRGLLSPGTEIKGLAAGGGYVKMSGTSVAAPFVTGAVALLWSLFPKATADQIRQAVLLPGITRKIIIPPLLDGEAALRFLAEVN